MNTRDLTSYAYVAATVLLTVYGQVIVKWQVADAGELPELAQGKFWFLLTLLINPWILSAFLAAFLASVTWIAAMTRLPLSEAYPMTSVSFVLVIFLSALFFHEAITTPKILGAAFIIVGIVIGSRG